MGLESTSARMSQLARQEMYFGRQMSADEVISGIDAVTSDEVLALASEMFGRGPLSMTVLGRLEHLRSIPESLVA
jgi:predicted Zn-dependent peptidase